MISRISILRRRRTTAFTLLEVLVAVAVSVLMMGLLCSLFSISSDTTRSARQRINASDGVRKVLDTLETDLAKRVDVSDLSLLVSQDTNQNTVLIFLTESRGPANQNALRFMAVAYQLTGGAVLRSVAPIGWDVTELATAATGAMTSPLTSNVLFSAGIRFEAVLLLDNGSIVPISQNGSWKVSTVNGETLPEGYCGLVRSVPPIDSSNPRVRGIIMGTAVIDPQSYKLLNANQIGTSLKSPSSSETPMDTWNSNRNSTAFLQCRYPAPALRSLTFGQQNYFFR